MKTSTYKIPLISTYRIPMEKQERMKTAVIPISRMSGTVPEPFAYQQITANSGDNNVIPYQINIYVPGSKPLNRIVETWYDAHIPRKKTNTFNAARNADAL